MIKIRPSAERGQNQYTWLETQYTFSFDTYHDPEYMGYRALRVINQDIIQPGRGFPSHPHQDMEIITYITKGAIAHKDNMGNESTIHAGEVQRMSAGSGVVHSEYNASKTDTLELLQIWIVPSESGLEPSYEEKEFKEDKSFQLILSPDGKEGSLTIHQDVKVFKGLLKQSESVEYSLSPNRYAWLQLIHGDIKLNEEFTCAPGDGAAISEEDLIRITANSDAEFLLFDLN